MTAPVFLADRSALLADLVVLAGPEGRHAATVRRLRPGEPVDLTDGAGLRVGGRVHRVDRDRVTVAVQTRVEEPAPQPRLVVVQALPKGDRGELAVELMTEVGVDVVVPWPAARCVTRWRDDRAARSLARWRSTAREAAKQARRCWLPEVTEPASTADVAARLAAADLAVVLDERAGLPLAGVAPPTAGELVVVVGPEGGLTDDERAAFSAAGAVTFRLGPTVLRTSTAGAAAASVLLARTPRWGGPE